MSAQPSVDPSLSRAEDILELLLAGLSHREIADQLGLSVLTIGHRAKALMHAAGATTDRGLLAAVWARRVAERDARIADLEARLTARESLRHDRRSGDRRRTDGVD